MRLVIGLLVVGGLVAGLMRVARRGRFAEPEAGGGPGLRRLLEHTLLLAALFTATSGVIRLLELALTWERLAGRQAADLALGLSLTLVGVPSWALLGRVVMRRLRADAGERAAPTWSLYVVVAGPVSLVAALVNLVAVGRWLLDVEPDRPEALASAVLWSALWAGHAWLARHPALNPTGWGPVVYVLAGCGIGLASMSIGAGGVLRAALDVLYRAVVGPALASGPGTDPVRHYGVVLLLGGLVWWWYWLRSAADGPRTPLWRAYVVFFAVLGGLLTAVIATAVALHSVLQWYLGAPEAVRAAVHFEVLPPGLAAVATGAWAWTYHHALLVQAADSRESQTERAYRYLVAGVGLVAAAAGATVAIMSSLHALGSSRLASTDPGGRNTVVLALTLLIVGGPLWLVFWRRLQVAVRAGPPGERTAPARRAYMTLIFGGAGLTAVVCLAVILFVVFRDLLEQRLDVGVLDELRAAIGLVVTAGGVCAYHWAVHRADRAAAGPAERPVPRSILLVSPDGQELADALAQSTGARVRRLHRLDGAGATVDPAKVGAAILASPHERVLVTVEPDGTVRVIPYED